MKTLKKNVIELLAPARNAEIGIAAVNCGADAVYIGADKFSAREDAGNPLPDIESVITHAHKYYARVYIALNTILKDEELSGALSLINTLYDMGADGLIIQDPGLCELPLPPIPLIASTQMNSDTPEKVLFLEKIGFSRVILPRECSLKDIQAVRSKTSVALECFVHGSLCVCYSGQCYLSYALGGRSANRGACAQPCRQVYSLVSDDGTTVAKDMHLLSLKDLNRADHLQELIDAGITSFKIEGRLKDKAYVTNVTSYYRKKIDALLDGKTTARSSSGSVSFSFDPDLNKTFNRGYTDYGLYGTKEHLAAVYTPKFVGEEIGTVAGVQRDHFTLRSKYAVHNGDGICFFDRTNTLRGTQVNKAAGTTVYPDKMTYIENDTVIYRNYDKAYIDALERMPWKRKVAVSLTLAETGDGFRLEAQDEDGNIGAAAVVANKIVAEKQALAEATVTQQLSSLNDTIFISAHITINLPQMYLISRATLNQLRRDAIQRLTIARENNRPKEQGTLFVNDVAYPMQTITYLGNCLNAKAKQFYERHHATVIEPAAECTRDMRNKRAMITYYCIKKELGLCGKKTGPLFLVDYNGRKFTLQFKCDMCRMELYV